MRRVTDFEKRKCHIPSRGETNVETIETERETNYLKVVGSQMLKKRERQAADTDA